MYPVGIDFDELDPNNLDRQTLIDELREDIVDAYADREEELGDELMRALERFMLLQIIDERWREHLHDMDYLREGIHLRGFAQIDPLVAYKNEGFEMFTGLMNAIWEEFGRYIFVVEVEVEGQNGDGQQRRSRAGAAPPTPARPPRSPTPAAPPRSSRARSRRAGGDMAYDEVAEASPVPGGDPHGGRGGPHRPQRPVLVRLGQEVQEVPWRLARAADLRDQLKLLADYL